jgi:hypothetical protein
MKSSIRNPRDGRILKLVVILIVFDNRSYEFAKKNVDAQKNAVHTHFLKYITKYIIAHLNIHPANLERKESGIRKHRIKMAQVVFLCQISQQNVDVFPKVFVDLFPMKNLFFCVIPNVKQVSVSYW